MRKTFYKVDDIAEQRCMQYIKNSPAGSKVVIDDNPKVDKSRIQEEKYHAMIADIARQTTYAGNKWIALDMKRILIDEFAEEMRNLDAPLHHDSRIIPSENGKRIIQLEIHSSNFYVKEAADFIEFLYAWGSQRDVRWTEPMPKEEKPKTVLRRVA